MSTTVFLVRHGAHDRLGKTLCGRMPGVTLSPRGLEEAKALADRFRTRRVAAVYASPMERTRQTAAPIAQALGQEVRVAPDLQEVDYGDWTGAAFEALGGAAWRAWNDDRDRAQVPGGESMAEVRDRAAAFLDHIIGEHPGQEIVAVSHGDVIKAVLMKVLGLPLAAHARFEISPGSASVVVGGDWGFKVHSINEAGS